MKHATMMGLFLILTTSFAVAGKKPINPPRWIKIRTPYEDSVTFYAINNSGTMTGAYLNGAGLHCFELQDRKYSRLDVPKADNTWCAGINSDGALVGTWQTEFHDQTRGFLYQAGKFTDIGPAGDYAQAFGINDAGTIVGLYEEANGNTHGFLWDGTSYQSIDVPISQRSWAAGINNNGLIAMQYYDSSGLRKAAIYDGSNFTYLDVPGAGDTLCGQLNDAGDVALSWFDPTSGFYKGAIFHAGQYYSFLFPGEPQTNPYGINDQDDVVGVFSDPRNGNRGSFLFIP